MRGEVWKKLGIITVVAAFACSMVLDGCKETEEAIETSDADEGSRLQIGPSFDSFVTERRIREWGVFASAAKVLGANVNVQNANGNVQEQIEQIEYFTKKQMDVIAAVAGDCDALLGVMKKVKDAGIKAVSCGRLITNTGRDPYISFDNEEMERLVVWCFLEYVLGGGDIFMMQGPGTDENVPQIRRGFNEALAGSGLNVVYEASCEGWLARYAFTYVKEELTQHRDIKGVMYGNDDPATQAFRVLSEGRLAGKAVLTGQDGDLMACQRIVEGTQNTAAFKSVEEEVRPAAEYAIKLGRGEKLADITKTIDGGTYEVPYRELVPMVVTRDNMGEVIIRGGLHVEEDVHLSVRK